MQRVLLSLAPYEAELPEVFEDYLSQTVGLPLSTDRLEWEREALARLDDTLEAINQQFRERIFTACWQLIDRFGPGKVRPPTTDG